ncbi:hypothetical protein ACFLIN_03740 [Corynebacterium kutscheri]|uniref:hypothetical protein n=1 Tax=Corynebacterium kutscheri TaxID=35755 RepID=UPI0037BE4991
MHHLYNLDARQIARSMWWVDFMLLVLKIDDLTWSHTDENLAKLIDREHYWLDSEYAQWVFDPEDPEVKQAQARKKQSRVKPPEKPIVPPVASRPAAAQLKALEAYNSQLVEYHEKAHKPFKKKLTISELRNMRAGG